ncbi:MAG: efflux RND transporter periplasmic adaptor subunit [candidate division Zixibacteria bacterium]|nr:efflux RND transporter periplasmic adaptor subunit [candidate division Zixibacteria bacterium]
MKNRILIIFSMLISLLLITSCSNNETETKNLEQIYADEGVPVKIQKIELVNFSSQLEFNAELTGYKETSAYASIADKIEKIYFNVGDYVKEDEIVLSFPTDNPSANYYQAKLAFENSKSTFERMKSFYESGGLSKQEYDNAKTNYKIAQANWDAVRQGVQVKAPISGVITRINVQVAENIDKEEELFSIAQMEKLKARVWVSDLDIVKIQKGQKAQAVWNNITLNGLVTQVDLSMNKMRQAFAVMVEFDNIDKNIPFGVTAKINILTYDNSSTIVTERKNIINENNNHYVFINDDGSAKKVPVVTGKSSGINIEILNGLEVGDGLIVEGQMLLEDGKKIKIIE